MDLVTRDRQMTSTIGINCSIKDADVPHQLAVAFNESILTYEITSFPFTILGKFVGFLCTCSYSNPGTPAVLPSHEFMF